MGVVIWHTRVHQRARAKKDAKPRVEKELDETTMSLSFTPKSASTVVLVFNKHIFRILSTTEQWLWLSFESLI